MRVSRVDYPRDVAPQAMVIERLSHDGLQHALTDSDAAKDIQSIGYRAWRDSNWLGEIAEDNSLDPSTLAARAFNPSSHDKFADQLDRIKQSRWRGRRLEYWFGETAKPYPEDWDGDFLSLPENIFSYLPQGHPQGFLKLEQHSSHPNRFVRGLQRLASIGVSACIHDVNVLPEHQGKGLGTALAYTALSEQPKQLATDLHTAIGNKPMRSWAENYGYEQIDEYEYPGLLGDIAIQFAHYAAPSVGGVLANMEDRHPWLTEGQSKTYRERLFDERQAEAMSINPRG